MFLLAGPRRGASDIWKLSARLPCVGGTAYNLPPCSRRISLSDGIYRQAEPQSHVARNHLSAVKIFEPPGRRIRWFCLCSWDRGAAGCPHPPSVIPQQAELLPSTSRHRDISPPVTFRPRHANALRRLCALQCPIGTGTVVDDGPIPKFVINGRPVPLGVEPRSVLASCCQHRRLVFSSVGVSTCLERSVHTGDREYCQAVVTFHSCLSRSS